MADPISVTGLVIAIGGLVQALVNHASYVKDAKKEIQELTTELFALKGVLEHIECQQKAASADVGPSQPSKYSSQEFLRMLESTGELLEALSKRLKPAQSRFGQSVQRMTWSFKRDEVQKQISRVERVKTWLVIVMTADNVTSLQDVLSGMSRLSKALQDERTQSEGIDPQSNNESLLNWLAPVKPYSTHAKARATHLHGTSNWFLQGPLQELLKSHKDEGLVLWLRGKSGSGKTTLMAHVVEHLKALYASSQDVGIAYFYISFDDLATQDPLNILGSFAEQLAPKMPQILEGYSTKFATELKTKAPRHVSLSDMMEPFVQHTAPLASIILCVDGVNESEYWTDVMLLLSQLAKQCRNARLLVSSTNCFGLGFSGISTIIGTAMAAQDVDRDIGLYLDEALATNSNLKAFSDLFKMDARQAILNRSNGMFRYAQWQITNLALQRTGRGARRVLSGMPQSLNESYERVLAKISADSPDRLLLQRALHWLSFASRPLHLSELADAVVLEDDDKDLDDDSRLRSPEVLVDIAQGLLTYDRESRLVSLAHSSIKTFLTSKWIRESRAADFALDENDAHIALMKKCLLYLSLSKLGDDFSPANWRVQIACRYPLFLYASNHWTYHIRTVGEEDWKYIQSFLAMRKLAKGGNYNRWIRSIIYDSVPPQVIYETPPLYYAASYGYFDLVKTILDFDHSIDLEERGGRHGSTALQVACFRRQWKTSKFLVEAGANPFSLDRPMGPTIGRSAFFWAKSNGWEEITNLMLTRNPGHEGQDSNPSYTLSFYDSALGVRERATLVIE